MYKLNRFGEDTYIKKGETQEKRRTLIDFNARISNPSKDDFGKLTKYGFNMDELKAYGDQILETIIPEGVEYTYGNRLRGYWEGKDTLEKMTELLKENKNTRFAFTTLWDPKEDLLKRKSSPCFTDIQLITKPNTNQLMALASFRTHNAPSAWLPNFYGIKAVQEYVSKRAGLIPGQINIKSRYLSLDPNSSKTISSLNLIKENRKKAVNIHDPKGNYSVEVDKKNQKMILNHYAPNGTFLEKIVGENAEEIKNDLRDRDAFSSADHAMWIGMELIRAQNKLDNENE
jgi:thymidylate synthase